MSSFNDALDQAKIKLISAQGSPFLANILLNLKVKEDPSVTTAYVDGVRMGINPDFFLSLAPKYRLGLLMHECWHVALDHITRTQPHMNFKVWYKATDYVINRTINDGFGIDMADVKGLNDPKYDGLTEIEIYHKLLEDKEKGDSDSEQDDADNHFGKPTGADGKALSDAATKTLLDRIIVESVMAAKASGEDLSKTAGSMSGSLDQYYEAVVNPKIDYRTLLLNFVSSTARSDYSYKRPNKKYLLHDLIMPTLYSDSLGEIYIFMDMSGSVSDEQACDMLGQVSQIQSMCNPEKITLLTFDTQIQDEYDATSIDLSRLSLKGRGGTCLSCVFEYLEDKNPELVIVMSDFDCNLNYPAPNHPMVCIGVDTYSNPEISFAHYIEYTTR